MQAILKYILPFILNYLDKRMPIYLEALEKIISKKVQGKITKITEEEINTQAVSLASTNLVNRIKSVPEVELPMAAIKLNICENEVPISEVEVEFDLGGMKGKIIRYTDIYGNVSINGLSNDSVKITAKKEGYTTQTKQVELNNVDYIATINLEKIQTMSINTDKIIENASPVVDDIIKDLNDAANNIDDVNKSFKELEAQLKSQSKQLEQALKDEALEVLQVVGADFIATAQAKLTESMVWYVTERKSVNPLGSFKEFSKWTSYTLTIMSIYTLRANCVNIANKIVDRLSKI